MISNGAEVADPSLTMKYSWNTRRQNGDSIISFISRLVKIRLHTIEIYLLKLKWF